VTKRTDSTPKNKLRSSSVFFKNEYLKFIFESLPIFVFLANKKNVFFIGSFGRHPQISIFRALRLLKIKMSGDDFWFFQKHYKKNARPSFKPQYKKRQRTLSLILMGGFWVFQKHHKKNARSRFKHDA